MKYYDIFCGRMIVGEGFAIIGRQHLLKGDFLWLVHFASRHGRMCRRFWILFVSWRLIKNGAWGCRHRSLAWGMAFWQREGRSAAGRGRLDWSCLDWNTPSIDFYRSLGAESLDDWTVYRLSGETLTRLAEWRISAEYVWERLPLLTLLYKI